MKPLISEFSYGYALTEELANGRIGPLRGAPIFPSLIEEGRIGGGYDVRLPRIGIPLFLQFKLSHHMERNSAGEWQRFGADYYRMHLRPLRLSKQHALLQELEKQGKEVYYVAPEFHVLDELNEAYLSNRVFDRSAFFRPLSIRIPDDREHYVAFSKYSRTAWRCSNDPDSELKKISGKDLISALSEVAKAKGHEITDHFFDSLTSHLLQVIDKVGITVHLPSERGPDNKPTWGGFGGKMIAGYLARAYFETEIFIISEPSAY
jgi:hypothetical protein